MHTTWALLVLSILSCLCVRLRSSLPTAMTETQLPDNTSFKYERLTRLDIGDVLYKSYNRKDRIGSGAAIFLRPIINGKTTEHYTTPTCSAIRVKIAHPNMPNSIIGCIYQVTAITLVLDALKTH